MKQQNLRTVALHALAKLVGEAKDDARADTFTGLKELHAETGSKSLDVTLPDGTKVASISLTEGKPTPEIVDRQAYLAWAQQQHPDMVEHVTRVREAYEKKLMEHAKKTGDPVDPDTGEFIPGMRVRPAPDEPKSFSVNKLDTQAIAQAWRSGQIEPLTYLTPQAIETGEQQ